MSTGEQNNVKELLQNPLLVNKFNVDHISKQIDVAKSRIEGYQNWQDTLRGNLTYLNRKQKEGYQIPDAVIKDIEAEIRTMDHLIHNYRDFLTTKCSQYEYYCELLGIEEE